eukprot:12415672-Karenia_brevis.AAC.1
MQRFNRGVERADRRLANEDLRNTEQLKMTQMSLWSPDLFSWTTRERISVYGMRCNSMRHSIVV